MKKLSVLIAVAMLFIVRIISAQETGSFADSRDGKTYKTVKIGTQIWMAENLNFVTSSGSWCYDNKPENCTDNSYKDFNIILNYGRLYNWETAKRVCPPSWHLPSYSEWTVLINYLGGVIDAGNKLKSEYSYHSPEADLTNFNLSGFSSLQGGMYTRETGKFGGFNFFSFIWSSTEHSSTDAHVIMLISSDPRVLRSELNKKDGFSVRCIKDKE